ncbi:MAG: cupredoxin domain-containing protein [Vicinamibacterales bacterium]
MARRLRLVFVAALLLMAGLSAGAQEQAPNRRDFTIVARDYHFTPDRIEVSQDDIVRIHLQSDDVPHSFAIDAYRILKRVSGGQTITFEFRADQPGTFTFYCSLTSDPRCQDMKGTLVVRPR